MDEEKYTSHVIARTASSDKFMDFSNGLVPSFDGHPEDYAMIHGEGGKGKAPVSVITINMTDFSAGTGENKSKYVKANIDPALIRTIRQVALDSMEPICIPKAALPDGARYVVDNLERIGALFEAIPKLINGITYGFCKTAIEQPGDPKSQLMALGKSFREANEAMMTQPSVEHAMMCPAPQGGQTLGDLFNKNHEALMSMKPIDGKDTYNACLKVVQAYSPTLTIPLDRTYEHTQSRVNIYRKGSDGFCPVSTLTICRRPFFDNGQRVKKPWTFKIDNFEAKANEKKNGTTSYIGSTVRNKSGVSMMLDDAEVFRCMDRVNSFLDIWEMFTCGGTVMQKSQDRITKIKELKEKK